MAYMPLPTYAQPPPISISPHQSVTFVKTDEPAMAHHYYVNLEQDLSPKPMLSTLYYTVNFILLSFFLLDTFYTHW